MNDAKKTPLLVIEDETAVLAFVRTALERGGYTVVGACSGVLGLEQLALEEFAGVIADIRTPGGVSGHDIYHWISQFRPALAKRVIFITGDTVNQQAVQALRSTGVPCIEKPFRVQELMDMVRKIIGAADGR